MLIALEPLNFYLNLKAFENMYTCVYFTYLWMSILGIEYLKIVLVTKSLKLELLKNINPVLKE